jgi:two-component system, sensor histidine kinase
MSHSLHTHRLLQRQLIKNGIELETLPENFKELFAQINQSYLHFEDNRSLVERAMRLSSEEIEEKNLQLHTEFENQKILLETLTSAFQSLTLNNSELDYTDLKSIGDQLRFAISERKALEKDLILARETAEKSLAARQLFLANISHEVRTPLNAIIGMSALLETSPLNKEQSEFLDAIRCSSEGLLVIINDILDMTKMESGKFSLEVIPFDIKHVVNLIVKSQSVRAHQKNLDLQLSFDHRINNQLLGDPTRINQILSNLISNAIKFTHQGHVLLSIQLHTEDDHCQRIRFEISDTGIGIDKKKIQTIFEEFTQEDESITRRYGGTGLGLAITKNLVEMMGGDIQVKSKKDEGSTFYFDLIFPKSEEKIIEKKIPAFQYNLFGARILLVEDNEMNRFLALTLLKRWNSQPIFATHGKEAIELLQRHEVDLVLMDLQMPVEDGFVCTHRVRNELHLSTPIIAVTANATESERLTCIAQGMNDYLSKPYLPEDLYTVLTKHLNIMEKNERHTVNLDLSKLNELYAGNPEHIKKTSQTFTQQLNHEREVVISSLEDKDYTNLRASVHKMKSSFALYKVEPAVACIHEIETAILNKNHTPVSQLVNELLEIIDETLVLLEQS